MNDEFGKNREAADYADAAERQHAKLGFLEHSLMISRLHFMLEMSARSSRGKLELISWRQGAELRGHKIAVPEISSTRVASTNDYVWEESDRTRRLPAEPSALFSFR